MSAVSIPHDRNQVLRHAIKKMGALHADPQHDTVTVQLIAEQAAHLLFDAVAEAGCHPDIDGSDLPPVTKFAFARCAVALLIGVEQGEPFTLHTTREVLEKLAENMHTYAVDTLDECFRGLAAIDSGRQAIKELETGLTIREKLQAA